MRCEEKRMKDCEENWMMGEWEKELPAPEELMPLTQTLITPDLAAAFKIQRDLSQSPTDSASAYSQSMGPDNLQTLLHQIPNAGNTYAAAVAGGGAGGGGYVQMGSLYANGNGNGSERRADSGYGGGAATQDSGECGAGKKPRKQGLGDSELEEADSGGGGGGGGGVAGGENSNEEPAARTLKRPRLVWTPQLHKRFVDAVAHLGIKNAVPKTIMQLMNVEGLTRENVASHLQKYRLYLKRMQGLSSEGPSASDQLFATTPVPPSLTASAHFHPHAHREDMLPLAFSAPVVPMAVAGLGHGHMVGGPYTGFDHHFYNSLSRQPLQRISPPAPHHPQDYMMEAQTVAASPPRKVLTLFPTGGN